MWEAAAGACDATREAGGARQGAAHPGAPAERLSLRRGVLRVGFVLAGFPPPAALISQTVGGVPGRGLRGSGCGGKRRRRPEDGGGGPAQSTRRGLRRRQGPASAPRGMVTAAAAAVSRASRPGEHARLPHLAHRSGPVPLRTPAAASRQGEPWKSADGLEQFKGWSQQPDAR